MPLAALFRRPRHRAAALALYDAIVAQARQPAFFLGHGVPDTLDGRFELLALHGFLVLHRLKGDRARCAGLAQELFDVMFTDVDRGLREMGVGDLSVGRHVKLMAKAFYGRIRSYERGLAAGEPALGEALRRNLYGTTAPGPNDLAALADYLRRSFDRLAAQPAENLLAGQVGFAAPPGIGPALA